MKLAGFDHRGTTPTHSYNTTMHAFRAALPASRISDCLVPEEMPQLLSHRTPAAAELYPYEHVAAYDSTPNSTMKPNATQRDYVTEQMNKLESS